MKNQQEVMSGHLLELPNRKEMYWMVTWVWNNGNITLTGHYHAHLLACLDLHLRPECEPVVRMDNVPAHNMSPLYTSAVNGSIGSTTGSTITEKAPTRAFS